MRDVMEFGDPTSSVCRWCERAKMSIEGALACRACDGVEYWPNHDAA